MREQEGNARDDRQGNAERGGGAPGKRTLTQGLVKRPVATFDPTGEYMESRATIEGPPRLAPRELRRARRKNRRWQRRLGFDPAQWSAAPIDSDEFALDVAQKQAKAGLRPDGIVGPETVGLAAGAGTGTGGGTAGGEVEAFDPTGEYMESRATVEGPREDDPFGLHLLG